MMLALFLFLLRSSSVIYQPGNTLEVAVTDGGGAINKEDMALDSEYAPGHQAANGTAIPQNMAKLLHIELLRPGAIILTSHQCCN